MDLLIFSRIRDYANRRIPRSFDNWKKVKSIMSEKRVLVKWGTFGKLSSFTLPSHNGLRQRKKFGEWKEGISSDNPVLSR